MEIETAAEILRVYVGESDQLDGRPLYEAIVEEARRCGLAGATVLRGVLGFGADSRIHTAKLLRLSEDLPMVVEIVDRPEHIAAFLPWLKESLSEGLVTRSSVQAIQFCPLWVRDVMTADVATVGPDAPLSEVVRVLSARGVEAAPVVEAGLPLGMVTGGDLVERGGMTLNLSLHKGLPEDVRAEHARRLDSGGLTARDVMTAVAITVGIRASVPEAARIMARRKVKRLPVVDEAGRLKGIVSRIDVLRTMAAATSVAAAPSGLPGGLDGLARDVMDTSVPAVGPDAPLDEVVRLLVATPLRRVVVVNGERRVLGVVMDRDLIERCEGHRHGRLESLLARLAPGGPRAQGLAGTAGEAMRSEVYVVSEDAPVSTVLQEMVARRAKRLVVLDDEGRLKGMVDRDRLLGLIGGAG